MVLSMPDFTIEKQFGRFPVAGVDEAGRGPLAGPVVASAVVFKDTETAIPIFTEINDSKKLSAAKRKKLYDAIFEHAYVGIGEASVREIDNHNILQATFMAMERALNNLEISPKMAIIDGNFGLDSYEVPTHPVIKGDSKSMSIAAASIIAKVYRDRIMRELDKEFPMYGWARNSGYGVKAHLEAIEKHGSCKHHRRTFSPIKQLKLF